MFQLVTFLTSNKASLLHTKLETEVFLAVASRTGRDGESCSHCHIHIPTIRLYNQLQACKV